MSEYYLSRYVPPEDVIRPNPRALGCLKVYLSWINENTASLESLEGLFVAINKETMNYNPLRLDGLKRFVNVIMGPPQREKFFKKLIPRLLEAAISYPKECEDIRLLKKSTKTKVRLSRSSIFSIIANSFFCTYNDAERESIEELKRINMGVIHGDESLTFKYEFFLSYFERFLIENPKGGVEFSRFCEEPHNYTFWNSSSKPLCNITTTKQFIEDAPLEYVKVDFANKYIGGGVLGRGCVQEEILFLEHPELIASRLFMEVQGPKDCIVLKGPYKYSKHINYGCDTQFAGGDFDGEPPAGDDSCDFKKVFLAIDAVDYSKRRFDQFKQGEILREINKAYCGFLNTAGDKGKVATGNWGCGAFKGNVHLKALIQVMAASQAGCDELLYCTDNNEFRVKLMEVIERLKDKECTVGMLYNCVMKCIERMPGVRDSDDVRILDMILVVLERDLMSLNKM